MTNLPNLPSKLVVSVRTTFRVADESAQKTLNALHSVMDGNAAGFRAILKLVIIESLFAAYRTQFAARLGVMLNPIKGTGQISEAKRLVLIDRKLNLEDRMRALEDEIASGSGTATADQVRRQENLAVRLQQVGAAFTGGDIPGIITLRDGSPSKIAGLTETGKERQGPGSAPSTGFSGRVASVLNTFTGRLKTLNSGKGTISIGFGSIKALEAIKTQPKSKSPMNVLWRQLEFGTGIFAKKAGHTIEVPRREGLTKLGDGSWKWGGLHLLGAHAGNWLRSQTGVAYNAYSIAFTSKFNAELGRRLRGG